MKLISASLLAASAMADKWAKLGDTWGALSSSTGVSEDDRKIIDLFTISSVANYGCWCRFNQYKPYKGTPQDTVDTACKQWYQNTDCLSMDYSTDTPAFQCDDSVDYVDVITDLADPFDDATDYATACATANAGNDCAIGSCHVDAVFIRQVFNFLADNTLNMTLSGWYGFNGNVCNGNYPSTGTTMAPGADATTGANGPTTAATGTTLPPVPSKACCGAYPDRFPYKTAGGDRQCCVETTYNTNILMCCPAISLMPVLLGSC